ncbi:hypothetical protein PR048_005689 [Dryococelus australis]|uniref:Uncharacterized protein n=1 Tax=Dryococelus australis TaxID=614101 RepID=A0ABQ9I9U9_9NEOP|nr:hypothetical protein PR048_005689 [Dryococelus australis]
MSDLMLLEEDKLLHSVADGTGQHAASEQQWCAVGALGATEICAPTLSSPLRKALNWHAVLPSITSIYESCSAYPTILWPKRVTRTVVGCAGLAATRRYLGEGRVYWRSVIPRALLACLYMGAASCPVPHRLDRRPWRIHPASVQTSALTLPNSCHEFELMAPLYFATDSALQRPLSNVPWNDLLMLEALLESCWEDQQEGDRRSRHDVTEMSRSTSSYNLLSSSSLNTWSVLVQCVTLLCPSARLTHRDLLALVQVPTSSTRRGAVHAFLPRDMRLCPPCPLPCIVDAIPTACTCAGLLVLELQSTYTTCATRLWNLCSLPTASRS